MGTVSVIILGNCLNLLVLSSIYGVIEVDRFKKLITIIASGVNLTGYKLKEKRPKMIKEMIDMDNRVEFANSVLSS